MRSATLWMFLLHRLNQVSCQQRIEGVAGGNVLLPCVYNEPLPPGVSAYWRDKEDGVVLDIVKGSENTARQDEKFKGRLISFPDRYGKGNFSIVMTMLQPADSGPYDCHITKVDVDRKVILTVSGGRVVEEASPPPPPGGAAVTHSLHLSALLSALLLSAL
ncbi:matrix remodeling-associated protein 8-like isoform X1 [Brachyistius frenatus]|uniref:matrix remodeling-associated protein 8-like isoform X1 n=2 Tax=Brachyistius frenatus TaxID=100188 RepID=UPI0037E7C6DB